nr:S8 family serine peptidase [Bacteroidota bacterium]
DKWYHDLVGSHFAWDISVGRPEIKIAIVDNAVFAGHLDLKTYNQRDVADFDNDATPPLAYSSNAAWSHGTHAAGLATAEINNNRGIASLGGGVELIAVKCTPNNGNSSMVYNSFDGVLWACQNGANIVSMSFGSSTSSQSFQSLINSYPNIVFFAAAGNDGNTSIKYPAGYNNVISVGSVNGNDTRSSFSNYNGTTQWVDIAAPGGYTNNGLLSTVYTASANSYARMGGTSMAAPFAAGLAGLMLSVNPILTPTQIKTGLVSTGVNINQNIGPRINAFAAMQFVQGTLNGNPIANFFANKVSVTIGDNVNFTDNSVGGGNTITQWQWTFTGGVPSSFNGQNPPPVYYNDPGDYDVTLTVTNSQSSNTLTRQDFIKVASAPFGDWIIQNSGFAAPSRGIRHISIADANTVWALGYDGTGSASNVQEFTKTTNGGNTWVPGSINLGNSGLGIAMIHAYSASTAWAVGFPNAGGQTGGIWKTTNGGSNWSRQSTASFNNASSFSNVVHFWGPDTGFCQGDPINGEFEIYTTVNGGTTWTLLPGANIPNPLSGEYGYTSQIEVVGNSLWFTTNLGRIYHSTNRGLNFTVYQSPINDFGGAASSGNISFKNATQGILVNNNGAVWKTSNAGANWASVSPNGIVFTNGLCWVEGTDVIFTTGAGGVVGPGSSYSDDAGLTWNIIDSDQHLYVDFLDVETGWSGWFNTSSTANGMWKWNNLSNQMVANFDADNTLACAGN